MNLSAQRLHHQLISQQPFATPAEVVRWFSAIQAQDYPASLWALGLRTAGVDERGVEAALADGSVIRMHGFRGTWQHVAREDARWMVQLVGARLVAGTARLRAIGLDGKTLGRAIELMARRLAGGQQLTRHELAAVLERRRIATGGGRLMHILWYAELRGVFCGGVRRGKQHTFALFDERVPPASAQTREQSLAQLAERYFRSRGPATERDLAWWSGLPLGDVRQAIALVRPRLDRLELGGAEYWLAADAVEARPSRRVQLLPALDECLIAYQDRRAFVEEAHVRKINNGGGILRPIVLVGGRAVATWTRTLAKGALSVTVEPFRRLTPAEREALATARHRYAAFVGATAND